jgi:hypothetical protein
MTQAKFAEPIGRERQLSDVPGAPTQGQQADLRLVELLREVQREDALKYAQRHRGESNRGGCDPETSHPESGAVGRKPAPRRRRRDEDSTGIAATSSAG